MTAACTPSGDGGFGEGDREPEDEGPVEPGDSQFSWGEAIACDAPEDGLAAFANVASARGLTQASQPMPVGTCVPTPGHALAEDLDDDGDPDLVFYEPDGMPRVHRNDGGTFTLMPRDTQPPVPGHLLLGLGLVDLDEDRLPDLVLTGEGFVATAKNLGGLAFAEPELVLIEEDYPRNCYHSVAAGDVDGDGWLDLFVPGLDVLGGPDAGWQDQPAQGAADLLFLRDADGGGFVNASDRLQAFGPPAAVLLGLFTDRDGDSDLDLLAPPDRPYANAIPTAFYRSEGDLLIDDARDIDADLLLSGMGIASADLNQDGRLDYCMTDAAPQLRCLMSYGAEGYVDTGAAIGLEMDVEPQGEDDQTVWEGWSLELIDLDNDGVLDAVSPAGVPQGEEIPRRDGLWQGDGETFTEVGIQVGFDPGLGSHYGLAAADFDGDGARDLAIGSRSGPPGFWEHGCTSGNWLEIELVGPTGNPRGLGSMIRTTVPGRIDMQEVYGPRGWGQSPAAVHVGLGAQLGAQRIQVTWPDGTLAEALDVPANRRVVVHYPEVDL